ncbi:MAG TPA: hypothetical protein DEG32_08360, partial [Balneolaceae bacterium]|nr:hypothetical protein [Balneolaceae bacterium]
NQSAPAKAKTEIQEEVSADEILEKAKAAEAERTSTEQRTVGDVLQKDNQPKIEKQVGEQSLKTEQVRNDQPSGSKTDVPLVGKVISEQATEVTKNIDAVQEIQTKKVEELQEKKFRQIYSFSARQELNTERLELVTNTTQSELTTASLSRFETAADFLNAKVKGSSAGMLSEEQELLIKNNLKESTELPDQKEASAMQFMRLGEMPISNFTIKRLVMPGLSQAVQKTVS